MKSRLDKRKEEKGRENIRCEKSGKNQQYKRRLKNTGKYDACMNGFSPNNVFPSLSLSKNAS